MTELTPDAASSQTPGFFILAAAGVSSFLLFFIPALLSQLDGGSGFGLAGRGAFVAGFLVFAKSGKTWALFALVLTLVGLGVENLVIQYPIGAPSWLNAAVLLGSAGLLLTPSVRSFVARAA